MLECFKKELSVPLLTKYKGYMGSCNVSFEDGVLHGKIECINDLVTYEASTPSELEAAFQEAVDDYLETCEMLGKEAEDFSVKIGFQYGWEVEWTNRHHLGSYDLIKNEQPQTKRVRIDKDYCSSVVWYNKANWSEKDFNFTETELDLANLYSDAWEKAHEDYENVDKDWYDIAEGFKFLLLISLVITKPEIEWTYWDRVKGEEVVYTGDKYVKS